MIPVCEACCTERYCPECAKLARYMREGISGTKQASLVESDNRRRGSLTRQLMINRMANSVLADVEPARRSRRRPLAPAENSTLRSGSRNVLAFLSGASLVGAFALGALTNHVPAASASQSQAGSTTHENLGAAAFVHEPDQVAGQRLVAGGLAPELPVRQTTLPAPGEPAPAEAQRIQFVRVARQSTWIPVAASAQYHPVREQSGWIAENRAPEFVPVKEQSGWIPADTGAARAANSPVGAGTAVAAAEAPHPRPKLSVEWPISGNTLRLTSYVKVAVAHPEQVSVLSVAVDGKTMGQASAIQGRTELPIDTTKLPNGDHVLSVLAMTQGGDLISSANVPISVFN
ncbi:MAG: hypothetical protein KGR26_01965 [Cyanobacteria bacterium REEB65]|nr:hypothetical protein [Cyanobacteria bacterium REEB65]